MSNFAAFLDTFKETAKRSAPTTQSVPSKRSKIDKDGESKEQQQQQKRQQKRQDRSMTASKHIDFPPSDQRNLTVDVSFLCIGAQKAGTTWLYEILKKIDTVGVPQQKEVHFWDWNRRKGLGWYSRQFPTDKHRIGEITPDYIVLPESDIREIHHLFPNARIIFIARDLVDRAWSAMTMELRNQARGLRAGEFDTPYEEMDASTRMQLERDTNPNNYDDHFFMNRLRQATHTERSDYATGLKRWLKHFSKEQILLLDYQDIADNPEKLVRQVLQHIGIDNVDAAMESLDENDLKARVNAGLVSNNSNLRPSLRNKMKRYLQPYDSTFVALQSEWNSTNGSVQQDPDKP